MTARRDRTATDSAVPAATLPVTTVRQAFRVAGDRTRRMTLLGQVPVLGPIALPWIFPLHLLIVGLTADHIRHTADASLSFSDGIPPRRHASTSAVAVLLEALWLTCLCGTVMALCDSGHRISGVVIALVWLSAPLIELLSLVEFAVFNPEWLTLKRACGRRADGRTAYVLNSLVASRDGLGHARVLMELTYPQWRAADAVVIGYPASRTLISYYVRMGARRRHDSAATRRSGRSVTFDCRRPLRCRPS